MRITGRCLLLITFNLLAINTAPARPPTKIAAPVPLELATKTARLSELAPPAITANGRRVAFVTSHETVADGLGSFSTSGVPQIGGRRSRVAVVDTRSGEVTYLGAENSWSFGPSWSADGQRLAFYSDEGGVLRVWVWQVGPHEAQPIAGLVARPMGRAESPVWLPDGGGIVVRTLNDRFTLSTANQQFRAAVVKPFVPPVPFERAAPGQPSVFVYSSSSGANDERMTEPAAPMEPRFDATSDLSLYDFATGKSTAIVKGKPVRWYALSPDGNTVAALESTGSPQDSSAKFHEELTTYDLKSATTQRFPNHRSLLQCGWSVDGRAIACLTQHLQDQRRLSALSLDTRRWLYPADQLSLPESRNDTFQWGKDGNELFLLAESSDGSNPKGAPAVWRISIREGGMHTLRSIPDRQILGFVKRDSPRLQAKHSSSLFHLLVRPREERSTSLTEVVEVNQLSGDLRTLLSTHENPNAAISGDGSMIVFTDSNIQSPAELWLYNSHKRRRSQLTAINSEWSRYQPATSRTLAYLDDEGRQLHSTLLLPPSYRHDQRPPLIVSVYGTKNDAELGLRFGPPDGSTYNYLQLLTTRGYAVLLPETPLREGSQFKDALQSVIPAINAVIEEGLANPDQLSIMGTGPGAYIALAVASQTARFKAVAISSFSTSPDLFAAYLFADPLSGDARAYDREPYNLVIGSNPWEQREKYLENSLAVHLDKLTCPVLIGQGSQDGVFFSNVLYGALKRLNKPAEYRIYENETKVFMRSQNILDLWQRRLEFYDEHMGVRREQFDSTPAARLH